MNVYRIYFQAITIFAMFLLFAFSSCKDNAKNVQEFKFPTTNDVLVGLATPVTLAPDTTLVDLREFFPLVDKLDSVRAHRSLKVDFDTATFNAKLTVLDDKLPNVSMLKAYFAGFEYVIPLKKTQQVSFKFTLDAKGKTYKTVQMKGEMNAWNVAAGNLVLKSGVWEGEFRSEPGNYQYVFVLDGKKEIRDPANKDSVSNGMGGYNSIIRIGDTDKSKFPRLYSKAYGDNYVEILTENAPENIYFVYQNFLISEGMITKTGETYKVLLPGDAKNQTRTHLRVFACNSAGTANDLLIPIQKGQILKNTADLTRTDFHSARIYNVFVDRFLNGNTANDRSLNLKTVNPKADYMGGDIAGAIKKIESGYFDSLGINTLWISPVVQNPEKPYGEFPTPKTKFSGYHGYWPISFTKVDDRLTTEAELKKMVDLAHSKNMNVLLDFVANHVHEEHPFIKANPQYATQLHLPDGRLNCRLWDEYRLTTWFDVFLPSLDLEKPEVYEMLSDSAVFWIEKYNLDGFRHDATKHIPEIFWQTLTYKLKKQIVIPQNRPLYQIGETYGSPQLISSYVSSGKLSAQFDFNAHDALVGSLVGGNSFDRFTEVLKASEKFYGSHHLMGNISGNQDRARFMSYADGSLKFSEDSKLAGWTRKIEVQGTIGYEKLKLLQTVIACLSGIPVIYYGDEIGMPGGNDPDNRRMMKFDNLNPNELDVRNHTSKVFNFRKNSLALMYGDTRILQADENVLVIERQYFDKVVYVVVNKSDKAQKISFEIPTFLNAPVLKSLFGAKFSQTKSKIEIEVPANTSEIFNN